MALQLGPQRQQVGDPGATGDEARVGDGVGGAGQEIGEPDGGAHGSRQHRQRQEEGAADALEQRGGEVPSAHGR